MAAPAFVIHGVANRSEAGFEAQVAALAVAAGRDPSSLVPVFWGDLGAPTDGIEDTIPPAQAPTHGLVPAVLADPPVEGVAPAVGPAERARIAGAGFAQAAAVGPTLAAPVAPAARTTLEREWLCSSRLKDIADPEVQRALGGAAAVALGPAADPQAFLPGVVKGLDHAVSAILDALGGALNHALREQFAPLIGEFVGDVLVYQGDRRGAIQGRLRAAVDAAGLTGRPVDVVAHSLGGVIAFELAAAQDDPLAIGRFITFGSQSPLFHVVDPQATVVAPYVPPTPSTLPATIGAWTNLWEPRDPLAFIAAKVFVLASGGSPDDRAVHAPASAGLITHTAYWALPELAATIRAELT